MKSHIAMAALAASLFAVAGLASAQQTYYRTAQVPGQTTADTWTDPSAPKQSAMGQTGMSDMSYGGAPMTRGAAGTTTGMGGAASQPCTRGPQCNIFFGN